MPGEKDDTANKLPHNASRMAIWPHIVALAAYLVMALAITYPAILHFTTAVPGDLLADRDQNLWNLWWVKQALSQGVNPFHTGLLYYPYGVDLYYHTLALPLGLIGLLPQLLLGLPAAYNTVLIVAFTLSGYGAFRLTLYVVRSRAGEQRPAIVQLLAAFLAGVVFAFTPYTLDALKGQPEVLSLQWMPFYLEMWLRAMDERRAAIVRVPLMTRRWLYAVLAGLFLALAAYSSLYYAVYLVIFTIAHVCYRLLVAWRRSRPRGARRVSAQGDAGPTFPTALRNASLVTLTVAAVTLALTLPLATGLATSYHNSRLAVVADLQHRLSQSADLLGFLDPPHDHLIFGTWQDQPGVNEPPTHDYVGLGYAALALAIVGSLAGWRTPGTGTKFWVALGLLALLLAMGPELQVDRNLTGIPLPFALLEKVPGMDAIAKPERFVVLARLCMSVLAAIGAVWLISRFAKVGQASTARSSSGRVWPAFVVILALLLVELPIHPRYMGPYSIPAGFDALAQQPEGGLMELPFATQQVDIVGQRMLYQTTHDKPIMAGYLARNYDSPIIDSCSPFWGFISPLDVPRQDIASPLTVTRLHDVLSFYGIKYLALYTKYSGPDAGSLDPKQLQALQSIVKEVAPGQPLYADNYLSLHTVAPITTTNLDNAPPAFHVGAGWYSIEDSEGTPFRWVRDGGGTLCVFASHEVTAPLKLDAMAFGHEQQIAISAGGQQIFSGKVPAGSFSEIATKPVDWQPGLTEVRISGDKPGVSPQSLDPASKDERPLTIGLRRVSLAVDAQK